MRLELIAPGRKEAIAKSKKISSLAPPLNLAIVAALTPPEVEISITDENLTPIDFDKPVDLVAVTAVTPTAPRAYEIADAFRARGVKVVLGGMHPTALPDEAGQHADSVVLGEAEGAWPSLVADFKVGKLKKTYHSNERPNLANCPLPRRDLFPKQGYIFNNTISATRGCPFSCSFCSVTSFFGYSYRLRPIEDILQEVDTFNDNGILFFVDDNIVGNPRWAKQLFRALAPHKLQWVAQASVTIAKDKELLELAAASGCGGLFIGFESVYPASLASVGKRSNVVEDYEQIIKRIHSHRISIHGAFILGFDHDDEDIFELTVRFAQKNKLESAQFNILTPYPATSLYDDLDRDGRILTKDWSQYHMDNIVFEPKLMSRKTLQEGHDWSWREFYSLTSIWQRVGIVHPHLLSIWGLNFNYRRLWHGKTLF